jgi:transposase
MSLALVLTMSVRELERAELMRRVHEGRLRQPRAAEQLGVSVRQVERMYRAYKADGPAALVSKKRGRPSNHRLAEALRRETLKLVRERYEGFGPTLAHEKLVECHGVRVSVETLRKWMAADGLWAPRAERKGGLLDRQQSALADVLAVERELNRVREESEVLDAELRTLKEQVALSTLKLTLVQEAEAEAPPSLWTSWRRLGRNTGNILAESLGALLGFGAAVVTGFLYVLPWTPLLAATWFCVRFLLRRRQGK